MTAENALAWFAQVAVIVAACAGVPALLRLRAPSLQHAFWRALLLVCLALPLLQPWEAIGGRTPVVQPPVASGAARIFVGRPASPANAPVAIPVDWMGRAIAVIAGGVILRLAWLGAGLLRLRRLRRSAVEPATGFEELQKVVGVTVPICWSREAIHPVTFGALRPVIVLPEALRTADAAAQRAVVAHELHHVRRRDWLWTMAEECVRSVFWFHPAMWWLVSRIQLARETVVDELSILTTNARRVYLDTLLAFADEGGLQSSAAFSARRHLFHRVMLLSKEGTMSPIRLALVSCLLVISLGAGSLGAVRAFPLHRGEESVQSRPAPPAVPQGPEANHALATHYLQIVQKDASLTAEEKLAVIAKGIAAEDRAIAIDPNYVPALVYKNILLRMQAKLSPDPSEQQRLIAEADELRHTAIMLQQAGAGTGTRPPDGSAPPPPPPPPGAPGSQMVFMPEHFAQQLAELKPVRIGGTLKSPIKIRDVKPVYPPIAQQSGVQGVVIIEVLIDADGAVADAHVVRSIPLLDQAALDAVRQWRFTPTMIDGTPEPVLMTVTVNFTLPQ